MFEDTEDVATNQPSSFLNRDVSQLITRLSNEDVNFYNFRDWSKELSGVLTELNNTIGYLSEAIKKKRIEFESEFNAIVKKLSGSKNNLYTSEPFGELIRDLVEYKERLRELANVQQLAISVLYEWSRKLEIAISSVEGVKISNEFLNRIDEFSKSMLEKGVINISTEFKKTVEDYSKRTDTIMRILIGLVDDLKKENRELMKTIRSLKAKKTHEEEDEYEELEEESYEEPEEIMEHKMVEEEREDEIKKVEEEQLQQSQLEESESEDTFTPEEVKKILNERYRKKKIEYIVKNHPNWDAKKISDELQRIGVSLDPVMVKGYLAILKEEEARE